jgi:hypothetical protein
MKNILFAYNNNRFPLIQDGQGVYNLGLAPTIYCGLKRLATILGARFRYKPFFSCMIQGL